MKITTKYNPNDVIVAKMGNYMVTGKIEEIEVVASVIEKNVRKKLLLNLKGYLISYLKNQSKKPAYIERMESKLSYYKTEKKVGIFYKIEDYAQIIPEEAVLRKTREEVSLN